MAFEVETLIFVLLFVSTQLYLFSTVKNSKIKFIVLFIALICLAFGLIWYFNFWEKLTDRVILFELALVLNLPSIIYVLLFSQRRDYKFIKINTTYLLLILSSLSVFSYSNRIWFTDYVGSLISDRYETFKHNAKIENNVVIYNWKKIDSTLDSPENLKEIYFNDFFEFKDTEVEDDPDEVSSIEKIFYELPENKLKLELVKNIKLTFLKYIKKTPVWYCVTDTSKERCYFDKEIIASISEYIWVWKYENIRKYAILDLENLFYIERFPLEFLNSIEKFGIKWTPLKFYKRIFRNFKEVEFFEKTNEWAYLLAGNVTYFIEENKDLIQITAIKK